VAGDLATGPTGWARGGGETQAEQETRSVMMSYYRVIPRDLFNEANLLKCYGQIYLNLERIHVVNAELINDGRAFEVIQAEYDGSLTLRNVKLLINGEEHRLHRPLNSRESWPLYLTDKDDEEVSVFNEDGSFTSDMLAKLGASANG
jgi:hypothetical protein